MATPVPLSCELLVFSLLPWPLDVLMPNVWPRPGELRNLGADPVRTNHPPHVIVSFSQLQFPNLLILFYFVVLHVFLRILNFF